MLDTSSASEYSLADEKHRAVVIRAGRIVTSAACIWIFVVAGSTLIGYMLHNPRIVYFPVSSSYWTLMPLAAIALLGGAIALWLMRPDGISRRNRAIAGVLAAYLTILGLISLVEYAHAIRTGIDLVLFRHFLLSQNLRFPGRVSMLAAVCLVFLGLGLLALDTRSTRLRRATQLMAMVVVFVGLERLVGYLFSETTDYLPTWRVFGEAVLQPMSPKTASCLLALAVGILFARPEHGLVELFLAPGPGGVMSRSLLPVAILLPITLGWLGLLGIRAGLKGAEYPLSLLVCAVILLVIIIVTLNARAIHRVDLERARAAAALAERERILRAVFDNARAGIFMVNSKRELVTMNRTLQKMLGYTPAELRDTPGRQFMNPEDAAKSRSLLDELIAGKRTAYTKETRYIRKDGTQFWGELTTSVAMDVTTGRPEFVVGMIQDTTARKEAEEARQRLAAILDATPDFVGIADAQGRGVYMNRGGRMLIGIGDVDVTQLTIPDFHTIESAERIMKEGIPTAIRSGLWTGETELLGPEGERIPVSQVIIAHEGEDGVLYISTVMRDITDRKRLEAGQHFLLQASRAFSGSLETERILRSLGALVVPAHADYCATCLLTEHNQIERAAVTRVDRSGDEVIAQQRIYPAGKKPNPVVEEVVRTGGPVLVGSVTREWLTHLSRGDQHPGLVQKLTPRSFMAVPLPGRGHVRGVICYAITRRGIRYDTTDLALAQEIAASAALALENAALLKESREATTIRDNVLRVVAHDLRNPLNTISLSAGSLRNQLSTMPKGVAAERLHIIERSVAQADRLIQDLLDVARMRAGKLTVTAEPTGAQALATEAIDMHEPLADKRGIELRCDLPEELVLVDADRPRVMQVLSNLIGNAIKFCPSGSTVVLEVRRRDGTVRFAVRDNGPGIEEKDMVHLFDPFWQAREAGEGAGLGLAISKAIVQAHGGKIGVTSEPGVGSTFFFTLNVTESQQYDRSQAAA